MRWRHICVLIAGLLSLLLTGTASATTTGIDIDTLRTTQTGPMTFASGLTRQTCTATFTKSYNERLVEVSPELTKIGKIGSGILANCPILDTRLLNLATVLGGLPAPGPLPTSWDIAFISSDLANGNMNIAILDFQVRIASGFTCLYRGVLGGYVTADGTRLHLSSILPLEPGSSPGCPATLTVTAILTNAPAVDFTLLPED